MVVSETFKNDYLPTLVGHDKLKDNTHNYDFGNICLNLLQYLR